MAGALLWFFEKDKFRVQTHDSLEDAMWAAVIYDADPRFSFRKVTVDGVVYDRTSGQFMSVWQQHRVRVEAQRRETKWQVVAFDESANSWAVFAAVESEERARSMYEQARKDFPEQVWGMRGEKP